LQTLRGHRSYVNALVFLTADARIATGSWDTTIKIWNFVTGNCLATYSAHANSIRCMKVHVTGNKELLLSGSADRTIKVWNTANPDTTKPDHSLESKENSQKIL
jgi:F-box/WD-40 domain protein MET30